MSPACARRAAPLLLLAAGCGLFHSEPELPPLEAVAAARATDAVEWEMLRDASLRVAELGALSLPELRSLAQAHPESLRLLALIQDVEIEQEGRNAVFPRYLDQAQVQPSGWTYYLAARAAPDREQGLSLANLAVEINPRLVAAQVLQLGYAARLGDPETLDQLVELLRRHPESAEGWRLLARLAPLYERPDLARAAADTEPWSPLDPPRWAQLSRAQAALGDNDPDAARRILGDLPGDDRDARLLQAAAWTRSGQTEAARRILEQLVAENPSDAMARFDLGLLALDYLQDPGLAQEQLSAFLQLAAAGADVPLSRKVQAQLWLQRLEQPADAPPR